MATTHTTLKEKPPFRNTLFLYRVSAGLFIQIQGPRKGVKGTVIVDQDELLKAIKGLELEEE